MGQRLPSPIDPAGRRARPGLWAPSTPGPTGTTTAPTGAAPSAAARWAFVGGRSRSAPAGAGRNPGGSARTDGCRGWTSRAGCQSRPRLSSRDRRLPSFIDDHDPPDVVGEAPLEAAHGLVVCLALADLAVVVSATDAAAHADLDERDDVQCQVQLAIPTTG